MRSLLPLTLNSPIIAIPDANPKYHSIIRKNTKTYSHIRHPRPPKPKRSHSLIDSTRTPPSQLVYRMFRKISLANVGLIIGIPLTLVGFVAYARGNATLNLAGFFYGIPIVLGGLALKAAELKPIPYLESTSEATITLRNQQATPTQNQIRKDVTRFRYGQQAHLDTSLEYIGLSPTDEERPNLQGIREEDRNGSYTLVLLFHSPQIPWETWQSKQEKMTKFFGPGVRIELQQPWSDYVEVALVRDGEI